MAWILKNDKKWLDLAGHLLIKTFTYRNVSGKIDLIFKQFIN